MGGRFKERILPPPALVAPKQVRLDDWTTRPLPPRPPLPEVKATTGTEDDGPTESERRRQPELNRVQPPEKSMPIDNPFEIDAGRDEIEDDAARNSRMNRLMQGVARQVSLDPNDGMDL